MQRRIRASCTRGYRRHHFGSAETRHIYARDCYVIESNVVQKHLQRWLFLFFFPYEGNVFGIDAMAVTDEKFGLQFGLYQQRWSILANLNKRNQSSFLKKMGNLQSGYIYVYREDCIETRKSAAEYFFGGIFRDVMSINKLIMRSRELCEIVITVNCLLRKERSGG